MVRPWSHVSSIMEAILDYMVMPIVIVEGLKSERRDWTNSSERQKPIGRIGEPMRGPKTLFGRLLVGSSGWRIMIGGSSG